MSLSVPRCVNAWWCVGFAWRTPYPSSSTPDGSLLPHSPYHWKGGRVGTYAKIAQRCAARDSSWILEVSSSWSRESSAMRFWLTSSDMPSRASTSASKRRNLFCICFEESSAVAFARRSCDANCCWPHERSWGPRYGAPCRDSQQPALSPERGSSEIWAGKSRSKLGTKLVLPGGSLARKVPRPSGRVRPDRRVTASSRNSQTEAPIYKSEP